MPAYKPVIAGDPDAVILAAMDHNETTYVVCYEQLAGVRRVFGTYRNASLAQKHYYRATGSKGFLYIINPTGVFYYYIDQLKNFSGS